MRAAINGMVDLLTTCADERTGEATEREPDAEKLQRVGAHAGRHRCAPSCFSAGP